MNRPNYIEAPEYWLPSPKERTLFLAGGITDCPDWQQEAREKIHSRLTKMVIFNPRRAEFPMDNPHAARQQIGWEFHHLNLADKILFWFPKGPVQPIALYELGRWAHSNKKIYVGVDDEYPRRQDVHIQMELARPYLTVHSDIHHLIDDLSYA